jgi:glycosyltransferase involved in cell wall biosynthesis
LAFSSFDLSSYDVVIVSATGAYFPNSVRTKIRDRGQETGNAKHEIGGAVQICYCHTPPRYLYGYATAREWRKNTLFAVLAGIANHFLRMVDFTTSKRVDYYIANSEEVARRIKKFYRRDATVIYPPVEVKNTKHGTRDTRQNGSYFLAGGRLARAKHVDLIVRACSELGVPLKVFGKSFAGYGEELRDIARDRGQETGNAKVGTRNSIEFVGEVSDEEKERLFLGAKAFLFAAEDEDFGILPVEALQMGVPVIAYWSGGVKETVKDGVTGGFYHELTVSSLKEAIAKFAESRIDPKACIAAAKQFSKDVFLKRMREVVESVVR